MSDKRLPNSNPQVKRKNGSAVAKTQRTIPPGAPVTQKHLGKMTKRVPRMESKLKWAMQDYLRYHPGVTAAMWSVLCVIVDLVDFRDGLAYPSTEYIQKKADVKSIRTVDNAIKFAHDEGLIFVESGGLGGHGLKRSNRYAPNFRLVLNMERGEIIRNAAYLTKAENWAVVGVNFPADARGCAVLVRKKCGVKAVRKKCGPDSDSSRLPHSLTEVSVRNECGVQRDNVVGGASASPARADAPSVGAPHREDNPEKETTKPADSDYSQPTVHRSNVKDILSYVSHTLAEWDAILSPSNPDRRLVTGYVAGTLSPLMAQAVESGIVKVFNQTCKHSPDVSPYEDVPKNAIWFYCPGSVGEGLERENPTEENHGPDTVLFVHFMP